MTINIHSLVENSHHIHTAIDRAIKDHMPTYTALAISFADCVARTPKTCVVGDLAKALVDQTHTAPSLLFPQVSKVYL